MSSKQQQQQQAPPSLNKLGNRLTTRQASAQARRQAMNERRQKNTLQIRKQKKSNWLAQKRGVHSTSRIDSATTTYSSNTASDLSQVIPAFLQQLQHISTSNNATQQQQQQLQLLQSLYKQLQVASMTTTPWTWSLEDPQRLQLAKQLVLQLNALLMLLCSTQLQSQSQTMETIQVLLQIFVQLTAMHSTSKHCTSGNDSHKGNSSNNNSSSSSPSAFDYYGRTCQGWSDILAETFLAAQGNCFPVLLHLQSQLPQQQQQQQQPQTDSSHPHPLAAIWKETCWLLGNIAQDIPSVCSTLLKQYIPALTTLLQYLSLQQQQQPQQQPQQQSNTLLLLQGMQAASWACLNIIRGDVTASGWEFVQTALVPSLPPPPSSSDNTTTTTTTLLTLPLLSHLISLEGSPGLQQQQQEQEMAVQTAWMLVHLSQREDDVVDYLLQPQQQQQPHSSSSSSSSLLHIILQKLFQIGERAQQQLVQQQPQQGEGGGQPSNNNTSLSLQQNYFQHPFIEPCLELFGHWATVANGKHVPLLLLHSTVSSGSTEQQQQHQQQQTLLQFLSQWISWAHQGLVPIGDYLQALWVSGCLLCDAGTPNHPSTTLAAPVLIPLLTRGLQQATHQSSRTFSLECKREGILALWNAITAPPSDDEMEDSDASYFQQEGQRSFLQMILASSASTTHISSNNNGEYEIMLTLKDLLLCQDVDAMLAAMHVINAILRTIPSSRIIFMECDGDEALEDICDLPLGNDRASAEAADLAADLIDEFFDSARHDDDDRFADPVLSPAQESGSFVFGLNANAPTVFMPNLSSAESHIVGMGQHTHHHHDTRNNSITMMSTDLPAAAAVAGDPAAGHGMMLGTGRGRGRGQVLPAWALQQQQQQQQL